MENSHLHQFLTHFAQKWMTAQSASQGRVSQPIGSKVSRTGPLIGSENPFCSEGLHFLMTSPSLLKMFGQISIPLCATAPSALGCSELLQNCALWYLRWEVGWCSLPAHAPLLPQSCLTPMLWKCRRMLVGQSLPHSESFNHSRAHLLRT